MWPKKYKDYPEDTPLKHEKVEPGDGIIGCEMHDLNGYHLTIHQPRPKKNFVQKLLEQFFGRSKKK